MLNMDRHHCAKKSTNYHYVYQVDFDKKVDLHEKVRHF